MILFQYPLDATVGHEPDERDDHIQCVGYPRTDKGKRDGRKIVHRGDFAFGVLADCHCEQGTVTLPGDDGALQDVIGDARHEQHESIDSGGHRCEMVLAHPASGERQEREPEKKMEVSPQDAAADVLGGMKHVVMIAPVNADIEEAQHITEENRQQGFHTNWKHVSAK